MNRNHRYAYRVEYRRPGLAYAPTHHLTATAAERTIARFFSPDNERAGAPCKGYPYVQTVAVLQSRSESGRWEDVAEYHVPAACAEAAAAHEAAVRARVAARAAAQGI